MTPRLSNIFATPRFLAALFTGAAIDGLHRWWHRNQFDPLARAEALNGMLRDELDAVALDRDIAVADLYAVRHPVGGRMGALVWDVSSN